MPGWRWAWCAEIEPHPAAVLNARFGASAPERMPDPEQAGIAKKERAKRLAAIKRVAAITGGAGLRNLGDVTAPDFAARAILTGIPDVIVAGTPCQSFSIAGARRSLDDDRGNLTLIFVRIVHDLVAAAIASGRRRPCILWENVVGVLSTPDNAFGCFLGALVGADDALRSPLERGRWPDSGMVAGPLGRAAWTIKDAQHFGLAQRRERVFVVVDFGDGPDPAAVLFERKSGAGDYSPRGKTREKPPARVAGAAGRGALWRAVAAAFADPRFGLPEIAGSLSAADGRCSPAEVERNALVPVISHALSGEGFDASEDGTGRGVPLVPALAWALQERDAKGADSDTKEGHLIPVALAIHENQRGEITLSDTAGSLKIGGGKPGQGYPAVAICIHADAIGRTGAAKTPSPDAEGRVRLRDAGMGVAEEASFSLTATAPHAVAMNLRGREGGAMPEIDDKASLRAADGGSSRSYVAFHGTQDPDVSGDIAPPLGTNGGQETALAYGWAVRRLTPVEAARLQGFPDDHAAIPPPGKNRAPDGPQYKAYGNSMAVPAIRWICQRIERERLSFKRGEKRDD